jgi:ADP-ribose pyrophosphatase
METIIGSERVLDGRLIKVDRVKVKVSGGTTSMRDVVRHPGAVVVLARAEDGRFVFVRQYRTAISKTILEAVAGTLHHGEDPADCARRETAEETGMPVRTLQALGAFYPAPGYTDEILHAFFAELGDGPVAERPDGDERIDVVYLTAEEFEAQARAGRIEDAKTLAIWQLYMGKQRAPVVDIGCHYGAKHGARRKAES